MRLCQYDLNESQLRRLAKARQRLVGQSVDLSPLSPFRLGMLWNGTSDLISPILEATGLCYGVSIEVFPSSYNNLLAVASGARPDLPLDQLDAILVAFDHRLPPFPATAARATDEEAEVQSKTMLNQIIQSIETQFEGSIIFQSMPCPPDRVFGSLDSAQQGSLRQVVVAFNAELADRVRGSNHVLFDIAGLAERVGLEQWFDPALWHAAKLPFAQNLAPLYGHYLGRILGALRGKSRKCLVLDLDNTIWGGVVGDDGVEGIRVGEGDAIGEAHLELQRTALQLRSRGVVLAVCSKNNEDVAREPFRTHPDMLLREDDIAVFQANWIDKAANMRAIADMLGVGIDSLVLMDDNPAERAQVRVEEPTVAVPELPDDPALYSRTLLEAGYFETVSFTSDDKKRAGQYQANTQRRVLLESSSDQYSFLQSMEMVIEFAPFDEIGLSRITQLINKSNQFNLTTQRYTEREVLGMSQDSNLLTLQIRLNDKFGDNGMISVVICRREEEAGCWSIDTWLMSCRVLNRRVEEAVLDQLVLQLLNRGGKTLIGIYKPSGRNELVRDHYENLGFNKIEAYGNSQDHDTFWRLDLAAHEERQPPMSVVVRDVSSTAAVA